LEVQLSEQQSDQIISKESEEDSQSQTSQSQNPQSQNAEPGQIDDAVLIPDTFSLVKFDCVQKKKKVTYQYVCCILPSLIALVNANEPSVFHSVQLVELKVQGY